MSHQKNASYKMKVHNIEIKAVTDNMKVHYEGLVELSGYRHVFLRARAFIKEPDSIRISLTPRFTRITETGEKVIDNLKSASAADVSGWVFHLPDFSSRLRQEFLKHAEPYWTHLFPDIA